MENVLGILRILAELIEEISARVSLPRRLQPKIVKISRFRRFLSLAIAVNTTAVPSVL